MFLKYFVNFLKREKKGKNMIPSVHTRERYFSAQEIYNSVHMEIWKILTI